MSVVLSTAQLSAAERASRWHDAVTKTFIPLDVTLLEREPSAGVITSNLLGFLQISEVRAGPQTVARNRRQIAEGGEEYLTVALQHRGQARLTQDGRDALLRPGEFAISDSGRPFGKTLPEDFSFTAFHLPRTALGVPEADLMALTATTFGRDGGSAGLVAAFLERLARGAATFDPYVGRELAVTAADLLALLVQERRGRLNPAAPEAARAMLVRVKDHIVQHLANPRLSPEGIAAAHHMSVRNLHRLFELEGTTVSRWIQQRRLRMCKRDLTRRGPTTPTVAAVAHRWGFVSPAHFSRVFRAAYGVPPREWQASARKP